MHSTIHINNDILVWAITRAGYQPGDFFVRFPKAQEWLEDKKDPTLPQLRDFARKVHLPFGYLFMDSPPEEKLPIPFFRTIDGRTDRTGLNVRDTILTLQKRQEWLSEYLKDNGYDPCPFVGKFSRNRVNELVIKDIRRTLGLQENWAEHFPNWQSALDHLVEKIEEAGIYTVFNSVVENNTHRPIPVEECRGFVLADTYAPFVFVNAADSKAAQMFTLMHELAHIWIGESAGFDFRQLQPAYDEMETFCDQVAAEFLVPETRIHQFWQESADFEQLAKRFKVSQLVIARRAQDLGYINRKEFITFYEQYLSELAHKNDIKKSGGNFYATLKSRLNIRFLHTVHQAVKENKLLYRDACELTGLKGTTWRTAVKELQI